MKKIFISMSAVVFLSFALLSCSGGGGSSGISATAPDAPSNVTVTAGDGQISLSWGSASRATSYTIYWKNSPGVTKSDNAVTGATSPYIHTGLPNGTAYYYAVSASNAAGESGLSAEVSATPVQFVPGVPQNVAVSSGDGKNTLSWSAVSGAVSYNIYWSNSPGITTSSLKISVASAPYTHQQLSNGIPYYYRVTAVSSSSIESGLSAEVSTTPQPPSPALPFVTNGEVLSVAVGSDGTTYIGGNFTKIGPATGSGVPLDTTSGAPISVYPRVTGDVYAVAPDGSGGWYIGGLFTYVGGAARNNIARILPNGSVDSSWIPNANGTVYALAINGSTLYVGGDFTVISGQTRTAVAALDATTGSANLTWDAQAGPLSTVYALALNGGALYVGGDFTIISGQTRTAIAALDAATGTASASWNAQAGPLSIVYALAINGSTLYVGGDFASIGGAPTRNYIAALNTSGTGTATSWAPEANFPVWTLAINGTGDTVYAGGDFTSIGSATRNHIAALNTSGTGTATSWDPNASARVLALAVSGTTVYAGGDFAVIGGQTRGNIAALNATGAGAATGWNPDANSAVWTLGVYGSTVYAGGWLTSVDGQTRNYIASLDFVGNLTSWNPDANNIVSALSITGNTVYSGGSFTNIGGQPRNFIAALNSSGTGTATAWNPNANGSVDALAISGSTVYSGGTFTTIGGLARQYIAALDAATGNADSSWDPNANNFVNAIAVSGDGNSVYAGGDFSVIGNASRSYIAALNTTGTGTATTWNPSANSWVNAIVVSSSTGTVYVGGNFTAIGANIQARRYIAALDAVSGNATSWDPDANQQVKALAVSAGGTIYAGGDFTNFKSGTTSRNHLAAIDSTGSIITTWNPDANSWANALAVSGSMVYAGGNFTSIGTDPLSYFARISQ